jgi:hypothetical protein
MGLLPGTQTRTSPKAHMIGHYTTGLLVTLVLP